MNQTASTAFSWQQLHLHKERIMPQSTQYSGRESANADLKHKATDQFNRLADQAEGVANRVAEQGREAGERVQEVAGNLKGAVDKSVKDQPMATLAMAAAIGFVLGALWKS
jgi:ElaB/YqjD/DUF883 family membrane-anchored ribosome-binding protein